MRTGKLKRYKSREIGVRLLKLPTFQYSVLYTTATPDHRSRSYAQSVLEQIPGAWYAASAEPPQELWFRGLRIDTGIWVLAQNHTIYKSFYCERIANPGKPQLYSLHCYYSHKSLCLIFEAQNQPLQYEDKHTCVKAVSAVRTEAIKDWKGILGQIITFSWIPLQHGRLLTLYWMSILYLECAAS